MHKIVTRTKASALAVAGAAAVMAAATATPTVANAEDASLLTAQHNAVPWAYQSPAGSVLYTQTQAVDQATHFDLIAANRNVYRGAVPAMRAANPNLTLIAYVNGAYAQKTEGTAYPDSWYLRDASGAKIRSHGFGNFLMDVGNPGWINDVAARCTAIISSQGYDGCFLDMMGSASVLAGYGTALPINPRTGVLFTKEQWLSLTSALSQKVSALIGADKPFYVNGLGSGPRYFDKTGPSSQLLDGIDGAMAESWLRGGEQSLAWYPTETQWKQNVDMITDVTARGKTALITVKTWGPGTLDQVNAWHVYSLASYLMAADGTGQYQFMPTAAASDMTASDALLEGLRIGVPTAPYAKVGGVYQRTYTNGRVLVNPTKVAVTVPLGGTYTTTSGKTVTTLTLQPNGAEILTRA